MQNHVDLSGGGNHHDVPPYQSPINDLKDFKDSAMGSINGSIISHVREKMHNGVNEVRAHIQSSSNAVRAGSFLGGVMTVVIAFFNMLNLLGIATDSIGYIVNMYLLFFGIITVFLEGKPEWMFFRKIQDIIYAEAHFLSVVNGRALFYLFEGSLFVAQMKILSILVGAYMGALGILMLYSAGRKGFSSVEIDASLTENLAGDDSTATP